MNVEFMNLNINIMNNIIDTHINGWMILINNCWMLLTQNGWLAGSLAGWLAGSGGLAVWLGGWVAGWLALDGRLAGWIVAKVCFRSDASKCI